MRSSTAVLATTLAAASLWLPSRALAADRQADQNQNANEPEHGRTPGAQRSVRTATADTQPGDADRQNAAELRAIDDLFARATSVALSSNALNGLESMIVPQDQPLVTGSGASAAGTSATNGGTAGTTQTQRTSSQASRTTRAQTPQDATRDAKYDARPLADLVRQIRQEWKQKYNQDFRIANERVVFADITLADVAPPEAQPAAAQIRGGRPANAAELASPRAIAVNVPAVPGTHAAQILVLPEAANTYRFASRIPVDRQQLGQNLQKHLQAIQHQQNQWPSDVNQAYRLVMQHVLMAIAESTAGAPEGATSAGSRMLGSNTSRNPGLRGTTEPTDRPR